jgi:hypothetical protein
VEVASEEEAGLVHPTVRIALDEKSAAFWYNPYQGVVRARVPVEMTDEAATALYNTINRTNIASIHWHETPMDIPKPKQDKPAVTDAGKDGTTRETMPAIRNPMMVKGTQTKPGAHKR